MPNADPWRLLVDPPAAGAWNMAVDEAILDAYAGPDAPPAPTLRLYSWDPPALSLGRSQALQPGRLGAGPGLDLVRRPTGGGAVLHDRERTYALCGRLRRAPFAGGVLETYRELAAGLTDAMRRMGAAAAAGSGRATEAAGVACFERVSSHEICVAGRKLIGSAQLRRRGAFLQHGSILLDVDHALWEGVFSAALKAERFTSLRAVLGRAVAGAEVDAALVAAFAERFGIELHRGTLTPAERRGAEARRRERYADREWTALGRPRRAGSAA